MARPLRIEYPGALYHVTSRGNARDNIYVDESDFELFLSDLGECTSRYNWIIHAWCLMNNHYHLLIETPDANLAKGMRHLNGVYTQQVNRKYARVGHLFQGRYKAILVESECYLLELMRYIVLNPVRANMVNRAELWQWSSYQSIVNAAMCPGWFKRNKVLLHFDMDVKCAVEEYQRFVAEGVDKLSPWQALKNQIYLGTEDFVDKMLSKSNVGNSRLDEIPKLQQRPVPKSLEHYFSRIDSRNSAICSAYSSGGYTMQQIGDYCGVHYSTISKIIRQGK